MLRLLPYVRFDHMTMISHSGHQQSVTFSYSCQNYFWKFLQDKELCEIYNMFLNFSKIMKYGVVNKRERV